MEPDQSAKVPLHTAFEIQTLRRFFSHFRVDCVLDVGANQGQYAKLLRENVGYRGAIVSFEPIPEIARALKRLAKDDPLWFIEELALTDNSGAAPFNVMSDSQFSSLQAPSGTHPRAAGRWDIATKIIVKCSTVDVEMQRLREKINFSRPFLKMDTQGHDLKVFAGAAQSVATLVGLQSELSFVPLYEGAPTAETALSIYRRSGFVLTALVPNNEGHFPDLLEMDCIMYRK
jgi:FkbM family methyltransferase